LGGASIAPAARRRATYCAYRSILTVRGFRELGSDSLIENQAAHEAHARWGFSETERVVYFRKPL
jgi:aminoglycoside 6'-N-acetyltransferase I